MKYVDSFFVKNESIMEIEKSLCCLKNGGKKCNFEFKIFVIEQINNGQISLNFAVKKVQYFEKYA
jgi:hypothetical protein